MKNLLKLSALFLSLLLLVSFISCGNGSNKGNADGGISVRKIENIEDYSIVRRGEASGEIIKATSELGGNFYKKAGVKVKSSTDLKNETKYEIIIGKTTRETGFDYASLNFGEYIIKLSGNKILIAGGSDVATCEAVKFFSDNLITADGVRVPTGKGYSYTNENVFDSIKIDGVSIENYKVIYNLFDSKVAEDFAEQIKNVSYCSLDITKGDGIETDGNFIYFDDTNTDFSKYSVKIQDGNVFFYGNHATMGDCVSYFFTELLGYDIENGKIIGEKSVELKSGDGDDIILEKKTPYSKERLMSVLEEIYNDNSRIIIGQQMSERAGRTMDIERSLYTENCGVDAAMYGYDLGTMEYDKNSTINARVKDAYDMIEYIREGGILTFSAH